MSHNMSHRRLYPAQYAEGVANQEYSQTQEALETQNEELVESLRGKVKELKSVSDMES
jgi:DNA-binding phage protein